MKKLKKIILAVLASQILLISCGKPKEVKDQTTTEKQDKVVDSLIVDINKDGKPDKVIVFEKKPLGNRTIAVELNDRNTYKIIGSNDKIIACSQCGNQSGDPYIDLKANDNGFNLMLEDKVYTFLFKSNEVFLEKIDILKTKQTSEGIEEQHQIYTPKDFGTISLNNFDDAIILKLNNHTKQVSLPIQQEGLDKFEWENTNSLANYNSRLSLEKYGSFNIILAKNDNTDDVFYTLFTMDSKGKTIDSLKVSYADNGYPESNKREITTFSIGKNYSIVLKKFDRVDNNNVLKNTQEYSISNNGLFLKKK
ncbi:hypothetical protein C1637_24715 [Chryseobacterium lactis]|uniref:Lipoprotein n=1 Tax=Chryseobacterium lactis TaxID=1241981 RepID=A0A3G6RZ96_CHRLC|nr:hypothetical protein [Chryseobacterium lactis]AZA81932.1 hypothetical protein EG342_08435 [Chryseobacterium lactis]AZB06930.1 hypothetical protein EG341_24550 [Chryseobacterium lactis]PNW10981.1 hypothetical protein C1637_24715 [Chryseobacterium lactis]